MAKQPETRVKFSVFNKEFNDGLRKMGRESSNLRKEFDLQQEHLKLNGTESDKLKSKVEYLGKQHDIAKEKVSATENQLAKAKAMYGDNSTEVEKLNGKLLDAKTYEQRLANQIKKTNEDLESQKKQAQKLGDTLEEVGNKASDLGGKMSTTVTPAMGAIGVASIMAADDVEASTGRIQASLGVSSEEAEKLGEIAQTMWKDAFGSNIEEVTNNLAIVRQNIKDLNDEDLQRITESAYILQDAFGADIKESTRTASVMIKNFGIDAGTAMDLMTVGFQKGGNFSEELLDTMREYSPSFSTMGHSAEDMMNILISGAEAGAWNLDKVGDAVKEFNIRAKDGSDTTADGFAAIGLNAEDMGAAIAKGGKEGEKAFQATIASLAAMEDPMERNAAGVALFGTQWEDLEADVISAMGNSTNHVEGFEGSTAEAGDALYDNFGTRLTSAMRELGAALQPLGMVLLDFAERALPHVIAGAQKLAEWFSSLSPLGQTIAVVIGALVTAIGPLLIGLGFIFQAIAPMIPLAAKLWGILSKLGPVFTVIRTALTALTGPVGITIAIITALAIVIYKNWDTIKEKTISIFNSVKSKLSNVWSSIKDTISNTVSNLKDSISSKFESVKSKATSIFNSVKNAITDPIETAKNTVLRIIDRIKDAFSKMKINIPKPKLPSVSVNMAKNSFGIPYPKFNVNWHKTGGVFTKEVVAGNAGFGDVEEAIVPFEGKHAAKIAGLIARQQNKLSNTTNALANRAEALQQVIQMTVVSTLDGNEVAKNQFSYINGMLNGDFQLNALLNGMR